MEELLEPFANVVLDPMPVGIIEESTRKQIWRHSGLEYRAVEKKCPICQLVFSARPNKMYCSPPCCKQAYRLRKLARTSEDKLKVYEYRECVICGRRYYPHTDEQKTCGGKECNFAFMWRTYNRIEIGRKRGRGKHTARLELGRMMDGSTWYWIPECVFVE